MKLFEVRDVIRENVGRDKISDPQLDWCIKRGLREIEKRDNFYWMEASQTFDVLEDQQSYSLESDILISDFKESEVLLISDRTADDPTWKEVAGPEPLYSTKVNFAETDSGEPAFWTLQEEGDDPTILLWPPLPDQDYRAQLHYYKWTDLPESSTSNSHEVLRRWPEALIYLATEQAVMVSTKDPEAANYWRNLFVNPDPKIQCEYRRIKDYQNSRHSKQRFKSTASNNNSTLTSKLRDQQKAWF